MNVFTVEMLERLEQITCPRCGGAGVRPAAIWAPAGVQIVVVDPGPAGACDLCNGERHVWRLRPEEPIR